MVLSVRQQVSAVAALAALTASACLSATAPSMDCARSWSQAVEAGDSAAQLVLMHPDVTLYVDGERVCKGREELTAYIAFQQATGVRSRLGEPREHGLAVVFDSELESALLGCMGVDSVRQELGLSFLDGQLRAIRVVRAVGDGERLAAAATPFQEWLSARGMTAPTLAWAVEGPDGEAPARRGARAGERLLELAQEWSGAPATP